MFEFSLENGKKQFKTGITLFIYAIAVLILWGIIIGICALCNAPQAITILTIIFCSIAGILGLMSAIKILFGAVVYHAERTSHRSEEKINSEEQLIDVE